MLCLSRRPGERIFVGPDIIVTLIEVGRGKARIGVTAPAGVKIYREEIAPAGFPTLADIGRELADRKPA